MLIIKRRVNEFFSIEPAEGTDRSLTIEDLFAGGCIEVRVLDAGKNQVKLAIEAPAQLKIWRREDDNEHPAKPGNRDVA